MTPHRRPREVATELLHAWANGLDTAPIIRNYPTDLLAIAYAHVTIWQAQVQTVARALQAARKSGAVDTRPLTGILGRAVLDYAARRNREHRQKAAAMQKDLTL